MSKKMLKRIGAAGVAAIAALAALPMQASAGTEPGVEAYKNNAYRVSGMDRYEVSVNAAKIAKADGKYKNSELVIASGEVWPDAISATAMAECYDAPVLLVKKNAVPAKVNAYIRDVLKPTKITIVGGENTISKGVESHLAGLIEGKDVQVFRNGGENRYEVAYNNAAEAAACLKQGGFNNTVRQAHKALFDAEQREAAYQAALAAYDKAREAEAAAQAAYEAAVAKVDAIQKQINDLSATLQQVPAASIQERDQALAAATAAQKAYDEARAHEAVITDVLSAYREQGGTTLDLGSTLAEYLEPGILTADEQQALRDAMAAFGLTESITLNDAIKAAADGVAAKGAVLTDLNNDVAEAQRKIEEQAAAIAANAPILKQLAELKKQLDAATEALQDAADAWSDAIAALVQAENDLLTAIWNRPTKLEIATLTKALTTARDNAVKAAGNVPAFLATGSIYTDALSVSPAAVNEKGVVLLTVGDKTGRWTQKWIDNSKSQLVSVGGEAVRAAGNNVNKKITGADRYVVSARIAEAYFGDGKAYPVVASGQIFSDALIAGRFAADYRNPLLLTRGEAVPAVVDNYLRNANAQLAGGTAVVIGGPNTISATAYNQVASAISAQG